MSVRVQLLWMDFAVARAMWRRDVSPLFRNRRLTAISIRRMNLHERVVTFTMTSVASECRRSVYVQPDVVVWTRSLRTSFNVDDLGDVPLPPRVVRSTPFEFWRDESWWRERACLFFDAEQRPNSRRVTHLLNQITRLAMHRLGLSAHDAVQRVVSLPKHRVDLLDRCFVEPVNGSLLPSHLCSIYMHGKQQSGLNTKHEAASSDDTTTVAPSIRSVRDFDSKIYLEISTSCVKRDIFELMISLTGQHAVSCSCDTCAPLRSSANAWRYYPCAENVLWLRLEFPRHVYSAVCEALARSPSSVTVVYTSDKNEFTDRDSFVANYLNYYTFYENGQCPVTIDQTTGRMRNYVSVFYVFAMVNWRMLSESRRRNPSNSSVSLNQQSLCKSLNNPLFSIFSENCINRMRAERSRRAVNATGPYVNRGLGAVPNSGVNAFQLTHRIDFQ